MAKCFFTCRKAALEAAIRKKIEYERKALRVVERLLEEDITEEFLVDCGKLITPSHYKDAVEERFIIKLCGYPICRNRLQNCFCSNFCYRASKYFEGQISKSSVWLREEERPVDIELLKQGESGYSGKEVKLVDETIQASDVETPVLAAIRGDSGTESESSSDTEHEFISSILPETLSSAKKSESRKSTLKKKNDEKEQPKPCHVKDIVKDAAEQLSRCKLGGQEEKSDALGKTQTKKTDPSSSHLISETPEDCGDNSSSSQVVFLGVSKKGAEQFKALLAKSKQHLGHKPQGPVDPLTAKVNLLERLRQTFTEWRTEETLKLLYGSDFTVAPILQQALPANYEEEELDEDDFESTDENANDVASERDTQSPLGQSLPFKRSRSAAKPLPSYEKLKEDTSRLELRVKEFYDGTFTLAEEDLTTQPGRLQHHCSDQDHLQWVPALPLVDSNAQQQIQKRIMLEKLRKVLPIVLGPLHIPLGDVYSELKNLVKTFRLTNTNIIHKTPEWTLIAIVLLSV
ncbi:hypothetical protein lerEdw1_004690 [Lerista edwardsae]|nr:hypothetical protein lerEdw1_004690 [Lerista edwardsae]